MPREAHSNILTYSNMKFPLLFTSLIAFAVFALSGFAAAADKEPTGVWKWTTPGRNGQPEETTLKLTKGDNGAITGMLSDRAGEHALTNVSLKGGKLEFTILRETPNGKVPLDYSLKLDAERPKIAIERPDFSPAARKAGKKRKIEIDATQHSKPADSKTTR